MTTPDPRLTGRSRPDGPDVDLGAYHQRYQNAQLAEHVQAEGDHLDQAYFHALSAVPPAQATEVFSSRSTPSALPQVHTNAGISPSQALGQPAAPGGLEGRARPSDYHDEETW
jgi:hypothetical protein